MALSYWTKQSRSQTFSPQAVFVAGWLSTSVNRQRFSSSLKLKLMSLTFLSIGTALALNALWPVVSYKLIWERRINAASAMLVPMNQTAAADLSTSDVQAREDPIEIEKGSNFNLTNWFPGGMPELPDKEYSINTYTISIPKLKIKDAKVIIGGKDLTKSIIHYKGTSVPGDLGQPVLYGHSNLPQFYDPNNYKTIFTRLQELEVGDRINVSYDGVDYDFQVVSLKIVKPDDFSVLEQYYNYRGIRLITCVPPGTTWERLVVEARLIE